MEFFTLYCKSGKKTFIHGETVEKAVLDLGRGVVTTLDFYDTGLKFDREWDSSIQEWGKVDQPAFFDLYSMSVNARVFTPHHVKLMLEDESISKTLTKIVYEYNSNIDNEQLILPIEFAEAVWMWRLIK